MPTSNHRPPAIAATSDARNAYAREALGVAKTWAGTYMPGHETPALHTALALVERMPEARQPLASAARTAYLRIVQELNRRALAD
jgi:hypothetical protein